MRVNNLIINGFDRSGSSALVKTLASHPEIEIIFQPFNSGSIRRKMYQVLSDRIASPEDIRFFTALEQGRLWREYIISPWHEKHSTTQVFIPGKLHVLKTTINHLTIRWIHERFPGIEFWGIWRDPFDILASLVRNDFYGQWYADALPLVDKTLQDNTDFPSVFRDLLNGIVNNEIRALAFLIAVRSYFFFKYLDPQKLINYEVFKSNPNSELNKLTDYFDLEEGAFSSESDKDHNVIGHKYEKGENYRDLLNAAEVSFAHEVFSPLLTLMQERFGKGHWLNTVDSGMGI